MSNYFGKENRFEFGHILVEILQMYTLHNLAHRAHAMTIFKNVYEVGLNFFAKENRFQFGYILVEILQIYTMHNLPHRAQVMTTFSNEIALKIRQGTVLHFRINTNFVCLTR